VTDTDPWLPRDPANLLVADPARCEPISFDSDGNRLAAHLYRPPQARRAEVTPGIVMIGPVSSVKEQTLPHYAERFADAGYAVLAFDPRGFGESEGEPRFHYDPWLIVSDYVNAAAYLMARKDVDAERVAAVVVCMGGGYALATAARERGWPHARASPAATTSAGRSSGRWVPRGTLPTCASRTSSATASVAPARPSTSQPSPES
jgi:dienelactone hydrolase